MEGRSSPNVPQSGNGQVWSLCEVDSCEVDPPSGAYRHLLKRAQLSAVKTAVVVRDHWPLGRPVAW